MAEVRERGSEGDRLKPDRAGATAELSMHPEASLKTALLVWRAHLEQSGMATNTVKAFAADLSLLAKYLGAGRAIGQIGTPDLQSFLRWMRKERGVPCSPKTYARRVTSLKSFFRFVDQVGAIHTDPAQPILQESVLSPLPEILTASEEQAVMEVARRLRQGSLETKPDSRPFTLLALLLETGIKKGECLALKLSHVAAEESEEAYLFVRYSNPRLRFKERKLRLSAEWVRAYREYVEQYGPKDRVFPWSPRRLEYLLEDLSQMSGLNKHLSFDMCRWTCAVRDRENHAPPERVREKLGLSRIQWREIGKKIDKLAAPPL
ncbi:MAG: site-specific integrase [Anaerolineales bacterium]|jgi:integrase/recombinase XerD